MARKPITTGDISDLMQNVGQGGVTRDIGHGSGMIGSGQRAQPYDFRRPTRFSKEHLRALQTIHEQFARHLSSSLASYLRTNVRTHLSTIEQGTFDEYVDQLPSPTVVFVLRLAPLEGPVMLELNLAPTLAALDRLCGGPGVVLNRERQLTEIERSLLQPLGRYCQQALAEAWGAVLPIKPSIEDVVLNPRAVSANGLNEIAAVLVLEFAVGNVAGSMSMCFPYMTLEPIMDNLQTQVWNIEQRRSDEESAEEQLRTRLLDVPLEATVVLGQAEVPALALLNLREGDVIRLATPSKGELVLRIANRALFRCRPGLSAGNLAVQITA